MASGRNQWRGARPRRPYSARAAALKALLGLDKGRAERVRDALDAAHLHGRDQALAYELAHGVVRRERLLDHVLGGLAHRGLPRDPALMWALRLGTYQLLFVGGMPAHSAVDETVSLVRTNKGFANALLRRVAECVDSREPAPDETIGELRLGPARTLRLPTPLPEDECERAAIVHSLPSFLVARWRAEHGREAMLQIAEAASTVPS
ncbi:MAG: hypothetical protein KDC98_23285, partial [Planctomycetes bacterium]|nr:hypothetical protein [Planctomycetota bacterium]